MAQHLLPRTRRRPAPRQAARNGARIATIVARPAASAVINDRLQAIGTGRANASVTVNPYSSGRLAELLVESGSHVDKGQIIATLDSETEMIAQNRAKLASQDAQSKLDRVQIAARLQRRDAGAVADAEVVLARRQVGASAMPNLRCSAARSSRRYRAPSASCRSPPATM